MQPKQPHQSLHNKQQPPPSVSFQKESIINLQNYLEKSVRVKFNGGREITGILKGYDNALNMVLDECNEYLRGMDNLNFYEYIGEKLLCSFMYFLFI
jgi:small nuclear ribonucleoprotein (snRNP)-like protein